jgi:hypothetical protein
VPAPIDRSWSGALAKGALSPLLHERRLLRVVWRRSTAIIVFGLLLRVAVCAALPERAHSADVENWLYVARSLQVGANPYTTTSFLNWPPFWLQLIFLLAELSKATGLGFLLVLRGLLLLVEVVLALMLVLLLNAVTTKRQADTLLFVGYAINPIAISQVCQHCNFDVFVGLFVLVFVYYGMTYTRTSEPADLLRGAGALGLGILAKTVPLLLLPALIAQGKRLRLVDKVTGVVVALVPVGLGMSIIYSLAPEAVSKNVLAYRSAAGWFGLSGLMQNFWDPSAAQLYARVSPVLFLGVLALTAYVLWRTAPLRNELFLISCAFLLVMVPALGPGYAPQYIYWFMPLLLGCYAVSPSHLVKSSLIIFGIVACVTYAIEYALIPSHGMALVYFDMIDPGLIPRRLAEPGPQTLLRLPLFGAYVALLVSMGSRVAVLVRTEMGLHSDRATRPSHT